MNVKPKYTDALVAVGSAVKTIGDDGRVGGYLISFGSSNRKDLHGQWFTPRTYYGAHGGEGMDVLIHHGIPLRSELAGLAGQMLAPMTVKVDEIGLWAETVLDLSDEYHKMIHDLVAEGRLGWSSGSAPHMVRMTEEGEITCWPIIEGSLTPTPAEWRSTNTIVPLKSLIDSDSDPSEDKAPEPQNQGTADPSVDKPPAPEPSAAGLAESSEETELPPSGALKASQVLSNENHNALRIARDLLDKVIQAHEAKILSQADVSFDDAGSSPSIRTADATTADAPMNPPHPVVTWNDSMIEIFTKALT